MIPSNGSQESWPALPLEEWEDTYHTLHMWLQIAGKIRTQLTPKQSHWWNSTLYLSARGLTTSPMPYESGAFEIEFDFIGHAVAIRTAAGRENRIALVPKPVSAFYFELMAALRSDGIAVSINSTPQEVPEPIPFDQDDTHRSYDAEYVHRLWRILLSAKFVIDAFRARFLGKVSPVHFFWGSFDLACTRFSGRKAPPRPGVISAEAYSHECSSLGWWPGSGDIKGSAFYSYTYPEPGGFANATVLPAQASYQPQLHEFVLMYDDVRASATPHVELMNFCQSTYEAGATLAGWDRSALER